MWATLPNGGHCAVVGQVLTPYHPGGCHGQQFGMTQKNSNKTQLLPSFLTVDRCKKAKQFRDPTQTLYSNHWYNKLHTNVKYHYSRWRAQLHFELSNVVKRHKYKKLLTLNKAPKNLWAKYGPIAVKLLIKWIMRHDNMIFWDRRSWYWVITRWIMGHKDVTFLERRSWYWVITRWIIRQNKVTFWDTGRWY